MAVSAPPKKKKVVNSPEKTSERKIEEIINRGSSTVVGESFTDEPEAIKHVTVKLVESKLKMIDELRAKRPRKATSPKLGISQHDWVDEAINEKIKREQKLYNLHQ